MADAPRYAPIDAAPSAGQLADLEQLLANAARPVAILAAAAGAGTTVRHRVRRARHALPTSVSFRRQMLFPGRPPLLHRRRGPGHQPGAAQARGRRRPDPVGRRPHIRKPQPGLHPAGHPGAAPEAGPCASRQRRAGARVRPTLAINTSPAAFAEALAGLKAPAAPPEPTTPAPCASRSLKWSDPTAIRTPGALQMGEVMAYLEKRCRPTPS